MLAWLLELVLLKLVTVVCVDKDTDKIKSINQGISPIYEEGLQDIIERNVVKKRLKAIKYLDADIGNADI